MFNLSRFNLMTRLSISAALSLVLIIGIMAESIVSMRKVIYQDREVKTRHLVEAAHGVVAQFQAREKGGGVSREELQRQALAAVKEMRYEEKEYFWINDLGKPIPRMLMHPTVSSLDGKVLDDAKFNKATSKRLGTTGEIVLLDHKNLFVAFNETVEAAGDGFVTYLWPKPKAGGGVTEELYPKLSYVKKFEPWGWVIGSGIYIDDVDAAFYKQIARNLIVAVLAAMALLAVSWFVRRSIFQEFGGEPRLAMKVVGRISDGDLSGEIPLRASDRSSMLYVLKHMQDSLKDMLSTLGSNAQRVESSIEQLSAASNQVSLAAQLQASSVAQTRGAIDIVSQRVETVGTLARDTEQSSRDVVTHARNGAQMAERVAGEMTRIASTVQVSSTEVARLVDSTKEIGKMADVIREIADQTNLLALNAAIEAARAGEQGRGFAVVADEVRKLAERTSRATQEIGTVLQGIHSDTERAVAGMNAAAPVIAGGVEKAHQAAATLREIEHQSQDALERMNRLTEATREQTASIQEIVSNVEGVMQASAQSEEVVHGSMRTAAELEQAAAAMFEVVERFRVRAGATTGDSTATVRTIQPLLEWSSALAVGHHEIDEQHRKLIEIANRLNAAMRSGHGRDTLGTVLKELVDYTVNHFAFEERLMEKQGYTRREAHVSEHRKLVAEVQRFVREFESGHPLPVELMAFVRDWLVNHILKSDKALAYELVSAALART